MRILLNTILVGFFLMLAGRTALAEQNIDGSEAEPPRETDAASPEGEEESFIDESEFVDVFDLHEETVPTVTTPAKVEEEVAPKKKKMPPLRVGGAVTLGIGGAALIAGAVTGALALVSDEYIKDNCDKIDGSYTCSTSEAQDELDKRDNLALATNILLATGAGVAIAGVLMIVFSYDWKKSQEKNNTGKGLEESISLRPMLGPNVAGATLEWRF
jgi:hypothetical protein